MHKILFVTTNNLTTNPRLYKEIKVASLNYSTTVLCFNLGGWSDKIDVQLHTAIPTTKVHYINAHRKSFCPWLFATLAHKAAAKLWPYFKKNTFLNSAASNKRSIQLSTHFAIHKSNYRDIDLIVAHNLGASYPAQQLSKQFNIPFTFDVEDYHPGERVESDAKHEKERREFLMQRLLPSAKVVTAASPLICNEVEKLTDVKVTYISNSFYSSEFQLKEVHEKTEVKFVWFSQNITSGRGLELLLKVLDKISGKFSLTLIGNLYEAFAKEWLTGRSYVTVLPPMEQQELHNQLSNYDVGLALEISEVDLNKQLALSNKIFAYLQAGLFVVATDTEAQKQLLQQYPDHGLINEQTAEGLTKSIIFVLDHLTYIRAEKEKRFHNAINLAYEREEQKLLTLWDGLVSNEHHEENNHCITPFPSL